MSKELGIGFVGAGMIGQIAHISCYKNNPRCHLVALADLRPELGQQVAKDNHIEKYYPTHRHLLDDSAVDAIVVVTRRPATGPIVLDAIKQGKHVLSEKPMAHTLEQAQCLVDTANQHQVTYSVGYMKRHDPGVIYAKNLLFQARSDKRWGDLLCVQCHSHGGQFAPNCQQDIHYVMTPETRPEGIQLWAIAPSWLKQNLHEKYAWFLNVFCHDINLLRYFLGEEAHVTAASFGKNSYAILLDFEGINVTLECAEQETNSWHEGICFTFKQASLMIQLPAPLDKDHTANVILVKDGKKLALSYAAQNRLWAFQNQANAFVNDILDGQSPVASGIGSLTDLQLIENIWRFH